MHTDGSKNEGIKDVIFKKNANRAGTGTNREGRDEASSPGRGVCSTQMEGHLGEQDSGESL